MKKFLLFFIFLNIINAEILKFINPFVDINSSNDNNITIPEKNETNSNEKNLTQNNITTPTINPIITKIETFDDDFKPLIPNIKIAILFDKKTKKYIFSIMNSLNSYFLYKKVNFSLKIFNKNEINSTALKNYNYIIDYTIDTNLSNLKDYKNLFFPILNKDDVNYSNTNFYFSGIDFKTQIAQLKSLIINTKAVAINENTIFSKKLTQLEKRDLNLTIFNYPKIDYKKLKNKYIFFNTSSIKTAKILSKINYLNIKTSLQLTSQIDYDPLLIELTQNSAVKKLIIANSINSFPKMLEDYNDNLYTNIRFNWLNYASNLIANKIYNLQTNSDEFFLNDFGLYIFDNQVNYKTNLYQIINGGFQKIY